MAMTEVDKVKTELESLKTTVRKMDRNPPEGQKVVFTPNRENSKNTLDRTLRLSLCQCLRILVQRVLRTRPTTAEEQVDFLSSHVERATKEEVRYTFPEEKNVNTPKMG